MKWSLSIYISAVNVDFVVVQKSDDVVNIGVCDSVEHDIAPYLLNVTNHYFKLVL